MALVVMITSSSVGTGSLPSGSCSACWGRDWLVEAGGGAGARDPRPGGGVRQLHGPLGVHVRAAQVRHAQARAGEHVEAGQRDRLGGPGQDLAEQLGVDVADDRVLVHQLGVRAGAQGDLVADRVADRLEAEVGEHPRRLVDSRLDGVGGADVRAGLGPGGRSQPGDVRGAGPVQLGVQRAGELADRRRRGARVEPVRTPPGGPLVRDPGDPPRGQQRVEVAADRVGVQADRLGDLLDPDDVVGSLDELQDGRPRVASRRRWVRAAGRARSRSAPGPARPSAGGSMSRSRGMSTT